MTRRPPQRERLLTLLRAAGPAGVHTLDLRREHGMGNPSQRKTELEDLGYVIRSTSEADPRGGDAIGARYTLMREPVSSAPSPAPADGSGTPSSGDGAPETAALFNLGGTPFDPYGEAA